MRTKKIIVLALFSLILFPVIAKSNVNVSWNWGHEDDEIMYYRYQIG